MKKKNLLVSSIPFLLLTALTGCGGKTTDSGSSEEPGTIQEKVFRRIGDSFSLTGTYTAGMTMTMNNPETGEPETYDSVMMESTLSSYLCGD
ncbi:MAG: hypothetical protein MJ248_07275, partial [Bacilli bacterium]|nr:hypothetical protein [Bacilli bacterium]